MKVFTPYDIKSMGDSAVREAYASLRAVANKRIERRTAAGVPTRHDKFKPTRSMSTEEVRTELAEVSRWIRDPRHTLKGERRWIGDVIDNMHKKGLNFINHDNIYDFLDFMDDMRAEYGSKVFSSSGDEADVYQNAERIGIPRATIVKEFDYFRDHLEELDRMEPVRSEKGATMRALKDKIRKLSK